VVYALLIHRHAEPGRFPGRLALKELLFLCVGAVTVFLLNWLFFGVSIIDLVEAIMVYDLTQGRGYWFWLLGNLVDFFILAGLPAMILAPSWPFLNKETHISKETKALVVSFWLILLALDFTGVIRAETGRIWLLMAPFPAILAAAWVKCVFSEHDKPPELDRQSRLNGGLYILVTAALLAFSISTRWGVIYTGW